MPGFVTAPLKTELFAPGFPSRKGGFARSKPPRSRLDRQLLKPKGAFCRQCERLPKSALFLCRRRSSPIFSDTSIWETFWESSFSGAFTSRPCSTPPYGSLKDLIIIALQVRALGSLRVVSLHRPMLQRRTFDVLEFLAFLFWLHLMLSLFGLLTPLIAAAEAVLNANLVIGSFNISLGRILALLIAVWASFLVSRFLRFLLEEDVYHHFHLERGIPYAISTMLHYVILLLGFFVALAALGVDLTKVTILAGAFTVRVGFGLQTVINNFVCGLILLFERPIKSVTSFR